MPEFGTKSRENLEGVSPALVSLFEEVVKHFDCTVLEGVRTPERQKSLVNMGKSKTLESKHLMGKAVDVAPYPVHWPRKESEYYAKALARYYYFGGFVKAMATAMGIKIRWGGDWDGDTEVNDQSFDDLPHFEEV
jgi:peptidoglycan L-alanyl-D-glutamate endopeptidase CwlK